MLKTALVWAAVAVPAIVAVWLVGIALCLLLVKDVRRESHEFQRRTKTWRWKLKLAALWPYWFVGIGAFEIRRAYVRLRKRMKAA